MTEFVLVAALGPVVAAVVGMVVAYRLIESL